MRALAPAGSEARVHAAPILPPILLRTEYCWERNRGTVEPTRWRVGVHERFLSARARNACTGSRWQRGSGRRSPCEPSTAGNAIGAAVAGNQGAVAGNRGAVGGAQALFCRHAQVLTAGAGSEALARTEALTLSLLQRVKDLKYTALVVTIDNFAPYWFWTEETHLSILPHLSSIGREVERSDPMFMNKLGLPPHTHNQPPFPFDYLGLRKKLVDQDEKAVQEATIGMAWAQEVCLGQYRSWEDLAWLRKQWEGPLILKGVLRTEDAEHAIENRIDRIVVSNHGGRQIDGEIATMDALSDIVASSVVRAAQAGGAFTVFLDSGVCTGTDVLKAVALGSDAWAEHTSGPPVLGARTVVKQLIHQTMAEIDITLGLLGYTSLDELRGCKLVLRVLK
ncbi:FMN-dependent dehydrogenase-domain-containing protein [Mycena olivaceomarginata]|nr:FMN-dependent dehydrogenase-domain-containing protein [Mycena olivaceomarginata]